MSQLKVLIITGYGVYPTEIDNIHVLASLSELSRIRFEHVSVYPSIQVIFTLKTLKKLTFVMCKIGDAFNSVTTGSPYMLESLKDFEIDLCYDLKELPAELCSSVQLKKLTITNCQELDVLPEEIGNLLNLEILGLHCCTKLKELPESVGSLRKLRSIDISDCSHVGALPTQIGELSSLKVIAINGCEGLEKLPKSLAELKKLEVVICDEERSNLWKTIASDHSRVKIKFVEEDRFGTLKKICQ
ncbi:putative leucine-rich repeat domain superfamily [Helianthus anomalus]